MYTVKELSTLAGVSVRTLHYYDQIGLLSPARIAENGYRQYDDAALLRLVDDMFETMYAAPGIGLAASQVDVHRQLIVMDVSMPGMNGIDATRRIHESHPSIGVLVITGGMREIEAWLIENSPIRPWDLDQGFIPQ